ncbi:hypothetical protein Taro_000223 [Colocasia esculenta]|uniref:Uncharacterized protein n=1 Tax=Colocasia esculenta TaxID=4460 RepID=A0A843TGY0_COLES|nr:hypothetical protein [Colocasia esculenta]
MFPVGHRRRPCERDVPIGRVQWSRCDNISRRVLNATGNAAAISVPVLNNLSRSVQALVMICPNPVAALMGVRRNLDCQPLGGL